MTKTDYDNIPGTIVFDSRKAMEGYALNKMCFSFNSAENREAFRRDEDTHCDFAVLSNSTVCGSTE